MRVALERGEGDPAVPAYVLQTMVGGRFLHGRADVGAGGFSVPNQVSGCVLSPPGQDCMFVGEGPVELRCITLPDRLVRDIREELPRAGHDLGMLHSGAFVDPLVEVFARKLQDESARGCPKGALYIDNLVFGLVRALVRRCGFLTSFPRPGRKLSVDRLKRLVDFMRGHLADPIDLDDLAREAGMGRFELARSFRALTGQSVWQYMLALRCERAAELLALHGEAAPLAVVAAECGFSDQSHLSRQFKQHLPTTPGQYRTWVEARVAA